MAFVAYVNDCRKAKSIEKRSSHVYHTPMESEKGVISAESS
jgi:hypothetical protein